MSLTVFLSTLSGSKNKLVHLESNIKWYRERWLHSRHNEGHTVSGIFTKFAVSTPLEHATVAQHCQHYQASGWPISANTRGTPELTNTTREPSVYDTDRFYCCSDANGKCNKSQCGAFGHPENCYWDTV